MKERPFGTIDDYFSEGSIEPLVIRPAIACGLYLFTASMAYENYILEKHPDFVVGPAFFSALTGVLTAVYLFQLYKQYQE